MFRFTIRDVLWLTALAALAVGWWIDRSVLQWRHEQLVTSTARLCERLDKADPGWQTRGEAARTLSEFNRWRASPVPGYGIGATLFVLAILLLVGVWRSRIHSSILNDRPRF